MPLRLATREAVEAVAALAREAGAVVMEVYTRGFVTTHKADASPVTEADVRAEALITPRLESLWPGVPVVAEEAMATQGAAGHARPALTERFWLVDPLDGTREFVRRNGEFTVNIALIEQGAPVLGVVFAPALDRLFAGGAGLGAWCEEGGARRPIHARPRPATGLTLCASRSHGKHDEVLAWLSNLEVEVTTERRIGSSLKFGLIAAGEADVYPRFSRTMEWDTAAGHAVLAAAGGHVLTLDGAPLAYGKPGFENPGFVAWGGS